MQRTELNKDKSGVFTGSYAINPINNKKIPIWVGDYVLLKLWNWSYYGSSWA